MKIFRIFITCLFCLSLSVAYAEERDTFGYTARGTDEPQGPHFNYIDISATGTFVAQGDGRSSSSAPPDGIGAPVNLATPFTLYGKTYNQLVPSTDGFISTDPADFGGDLSNDCPLPNSPSTPGGTTGARIYPLHDDLDLEPGSGSILFEYFADCPRQYDLGGTVGCHVFSWDKAEHWPGDGADTFNFQVIIYDNNDIVFQYGPGNPEAGSSSTTGMQSEAPGDGRGPEHGLTIACNAAGSISSGRAYWIFLDKDNDGTPDHLDECNANPNKFVAGVCGCDTPDIDSDGDGAMDCIDECGSDATKFTAGFCGCGIAETDSDGDGTADCVDQCPSDSAKTSAGICGCGVSEADSDLDGTPDCSDQCVSDPAKSQAGICGCGIADKDTDGDKYYDCEDQCVSDPAKSTPGSCGCGVLDSDSNENGIVDCLGAQEIAFQAQSLQSLVKRLRRISAATPSQKKKRFNKSKKAAKAELQNLLDFVNNAKDSSVFVSSETLNAVQNAVKKSLKLKSKKFGKNKKNALKAVQLLIG